MHSSTWDEQRPQERQMSVAAFQQGLNDYCNVVSDAVLGHLPGQTFLKLYTQQETLKIGFSGIKDRASTMAIAGHQKPL